MGGINICLKFQKIMPSFKPMAAMQKPALKAKHGEVDKAVDAGVGLAKGGLKNS